MTARFSAIALALIILAGCGPDGRGIACPPLFKYTQSQTQRAKAELDAIKAPTLELFLNDYGITRDAIRACLKHRENDRRSNKAAKGVSKAEAPQSGTRSP